MPVDIRRGLEIGITQGNKDDRASRLSGRLVVLIVLPLLLLIGLGIVYAIKYFSLVSDVRTACAGRIAALDLTDWIAVCKETM